MIYKSERFPLWISKENFILLSFEDKNYEKNKCFLINEHAEISIIFEDKLSRVSNSSLILCKIQYFDDKENEKEILQNCVFMDSKSFCNSNLTENLVYTLSSFYLQEKVPKK